MAFGRNTIVSLVVLALALGAVAAVIPGYRAAEQDDVIRKGPGVTEVRTLSTWFPGLGGTNGDTDVYVLDSGKPGATGLVLGGTHGNEPAGYMTAILIVETRGANGGRLLVIPHANRSSVTHTDYQEASPRRARVPGRVGPPRVPLRQPGHEPHRPVAGSRHLRARLVGAAAVGRGDPQPQPRLSGPAGRHVHRAGGLRASRRSSDPEKVDLVVDLHEASPEYPVVNAIVAHERAMPVASVAVLNLEFDDIKIGLEPSPRNLRGLSHRELGDATDALALLCETSNVSQGRLRGATDARQVIEGTDDKYLRAAQTRAALRALRREGLAHEAAGGPPRGDGRGDPRRLHIGASRRSRFPSPVSPPTPTSWRRGWSRTSRTRIRR